MYVSKGWNLDPLKNHRPSHQKYIVKLMYTYGTIPKLRQHIFGLFLTHPPYFSINSTERQQKLPFF